ncbi:MAG TPA: nicotinate phosphoribosyltransferase [Myxococcaceae bacterium]|nr:nicotinate phosphoribosyltransferase [Myxococcaceae bacterium]
MNEAHWISDETAPLLTDLYELTMLRSYFEEGLEGRAVFSLFVRRLPEARNFLLACGLDDVLRYLERLSFPEAVLHQLKKLDRFPSDFLDRLSRLRFTGDVWAMPEGMPFFASEPLLEVCAPLPEAQLVETFLLNTIHLGSLIASKAARVALAAAGRQVVDFGLRRMQGADAGLKGARAMYVGGIDATSNVLAGCTYGIPLAGTMAHSFIQTHPDELSAFRAFVRLYPSTILLVDTFDTLQGVENIVRLAKELGDRFQVHGIRLDSGDLLELSKTARARLDEAGLSNVEIFASGELDEHEIERLISHGAPIQGFGVGTAMGVSADAPSLDVAYKLVSYEGETRVKLSPGKEVLPGQKQVFRIEDNGIASRDALACFGEALPGRPLLSLVMRAGRRLSPPEPLDRIRARARDEIALLPAALRQISRAEPPYPVEPSAALMAERDRVLAKLRQAGEKRTR